jgi:hypothetical protein
MMLAVLPCLAYTRIQVSFDHVKRTFALSRNSHGLDLLYPQIYWCTVSNLDGGHAYRCKIISQLQASRLVLHRWR